MQVKFHVLTPGQSFIWRSHRYVKTGPVTATSPDGHQKMIPRSAAVTLAPDTATDGTEENPRPDIVRREFQTRIEERLDLLSAELSPAELERLKADLKELTDRFLATIQPGETSG